MVSGPDDRHFEKATMNIRRYGQKQETRTLDSLQLAAALDVLGTRFVSCRAGDLCLRNVLCEFMCEFMDDGSRTYRFPFWSRKGAKKMSIIPGMETKKLIPKKYP